MLISLVVRTSETGRITVGRTAIPDERWTVIKIWIVPLFYIL